MGEISLVTHSWPHIEQEQEREHHMYLIYFITLLRSEQNGCLFADEICKYSLPSTILAFWYKCKVEHVSQH